MLQTIFIHELVEVALEKARAAGCGWMHVDFDNHLREFYFNACSFSPVPAGVIQLRGS